MSKPTDQDERTGIVLFEVKGECKHHLISKSCVSQAKQAGGKSPHESIPHAGLSFTADKFVDVAEMLVYVGSIPVDTSEILEQRLNKSREVDDCYEPDLRKNHPGADDTPISHQLQFALGALCRNQNIKVTGSVRDASIQKPGPYTWDNRFRLERIRHNPDLGIDSTDSCQAAVKEVYHNVVQGCTITCGRPTVTYCESEGRWQRCATLCLDH